MSEQHEFNVLVSVVQIVTADSPEQAVHLLSLQLGRDGYDVHDDPVEHPSSALHSETCPCGADYSVAPWQPGDIAGLDVALVRVRLINVGPVWARVESYPQRAGGQSLQVVVARLVRLS